jgi:hypothetical protein
VFVPLRRTVDSSVANTLLENEGHWGCSVVRLGEPVAIPLRRKGDSSHLQRGGHMCDDSPPPFSPFPPS